MKKKIGIAIGVICIAIMVVFFIYVGDYYRPELEALTAAELGETINGNLVFRGEKEVGFIIYPGGKVDERAYASLAKELHDEGHTVIIAKMPFRLSILNSSKAKSIVDTYTEVDEWVIIGHSLGGTSASIFAEKYPDDISGVVFLGSYPYRDLSSIDVNVLSILGSEDMVLDISKADDSFYPDTTEVIILDGANHAQFGRYGDQKGDGQASITWQEQHQMTVSNIIEYFVE